MTCPKANPVNCTSQRRPLTVSGQKRLRSLTGIGRFTTLAALAFCLTGCASPDGGRDVCGIRNSRYVPGLVNVAVNSKPSEADLLCLKAAGLTNLVCFIRPHYKHIPEGMTLHQHPISFLMQVFGGKRMDRAYAAALAEVTPGTDLFCRHGANRSGAAYVALLMRSGLSKADAIALANRYGYGSSFWGTKDWVNKLPENKSKQ